jgi:hypothetical protein
MTEQMIAQAEANCAPQTLEIMITDKDDEARQVSQSRERLRIQDFQE